MNDADRCHAVIRFKRALTFPRFSVTAGETCGFVVFGKWAKNLLAIKAGGRFDYAGGQCLAQDVEIVYEGPVGLEFSVAAGYITGAPVQRFAPNPCLAPVQYIHPQAVKTTLQVIVLAPKANLSLDLNRPAAMSSDDPRRNIQSGYITPLGRKFAIALKMEILESLVVKNLCAFGWFVDDRGGTAVATKKYQTAVGVKEALAFLCSFSPSDTNYVLTAQYESEGRNVLASHLVLIPKTADADTVTGLVKRFAEEADAVIAASYAARLLKASK